MSAADREMIRQARPPTPRIGLVLLVLGAAAVIALAAAGGGLLLPPLEPDPRASRLIRATGLLLAGLGLAALLLQRRRLRTPGARETDPTVAAIAVAALIMIALVMTSLAMPAPRPLEFAEGSAPPPEQPQYEAGDPDRSPGADAPRPGGSMLPITNSRGRGGWPRRIATLFGDGPPRLDMPGQDRLSLLRRIMIGLFGLLAAAIVVLSLWIMLRRTGRADPAPEEPDEPTDTGDDAIPWGGDVAYDGPDPRRRIAAAYHRLLAELRAAGAPARPQEAPHEYLRRSLPPLGLEAAPMRRLADLYILAQFSPQPITEPHCAAASAALATSLARLHELHGAAPSHAAMDAPGGNA